MYVQLRGRKRVVLFPPSDYVQCYPFPCGHPCDRHSMVNVARYRSDEAMQEVFPRFASARGHEAILQPGDLLYLPYGWWHYFRSEDSGSVSVAFWYNTSPPEPFKDGKLCITDRLLVRVRRNLEMMVVSAIENEGKDV